MPSVYCTVLGSVLSSSLPSFILCISSRRDRKPQMKCPPKPHTALATFPGPSSLKLPEMLRALGSLLPWLRGNQRDSVTCPTSHSSQATELENSGQGTPKPLFFPQPPLGAQGLRNMGRWGQGSLLSCPWLWSQGLWPQQLGPLQI